MVHEILNLDFLTILAFFIKISVAWGIALLIIGLTFLALFFMLHKFVEGGWFR